jgi:hypothetical protein
MIEKLKEYAILVWLMIWIIPSLPELIEQGKYEENPEGYLMRRN